MNFLIPNFDYISTGSDQGKREIINPFTKVTEFVLNLDDAKEHLYKDSKHRIHRWNDLKVNIYV